MATRTPQDSPEPPRHTATRERPGRDGGATRHDDARTIEADDHAARPAAQHLPLNLLRRPAKAAPAPVGERTANLAAGTVDRMEQAAEIMTPAAEEAAIPAETGADDPAGT